MAQMEKTSKKLEVYLGDLQKEVDKPSRELLMKEIELKELPLEVKHGLETTGEGAEWLYSDPLKIAWLLWFWTQASKAKKILSEIKMKGHQLHMLELAIIVGSLAIAGKIMKMEMAKIFEMTMQAFVAMQLAKIAGKLEALEMLQMKMWQEINHICFSCTNAGGNLLSVSMKQVEKLAYIEGRIMMFWWEDSEISRHISTILGSWSRSEAQIKDGLANLKESWNAARNRLGDLAARDRDAKWQALVESCVEKELEEISSWLTYFGSEESEKATASMKEVAAHKLEILSFRKSCRSGVRGEGDESGGGEGTELPVPANTA